MMIKYTTGRELFDSTGQSYIGYYYLDKFDKPYAGRDKTNKDIRLLTTQELNRENYRFNTKIANTQSQRPILHKPTIEEENYSVGVVLRYFAQKKNNSSNIVEISEDQYNSYGSEIGINSNLWNVSTITWTIVGTFSSVLIANNNELERLNKQYPLLKSYFKNLTRYARITDKQTRV